MVEHEGRVLSEPCGEDDDLEGLGGLFEQLVDPRALQNVEGEDLAIDYGVDGEVVPLGWGVGLGMDQGLVEVQNDGLSSRA